MSLLNRNGVYFPWASHIIQLLLLFIAFGIWIALILHWNRLIIGKCVAFIEFHGCITNTFKINLVQANISFTFFQVLILLKAHLFSCIHLRNARQGRRNQGDKGEICIPPHIFWKISLPSSNRVGQIIPTTLLLAHPPPDFRTFRWLWMQDEWTKKKINLPICFVFKAKYYKGHSTHWCWIIKWFSIL